MFIHGKLTLTHHNFMLDEIRSLIQKALRRKEWVLALQAAKELLAYDKDQLPWKCIVTFLLEDHGLSDTDVLMVIFKAFEERTVEAKYRCIELLMQCKTCRVNACLPVIALDTPYEPKNWDENIEVRDSVRGLIVHGKGQINTDQLLEHLLRAWKSNNPDGVITYMKLATMVVEHEKRQLTSKGNGYLISTVGKIRKPHFGLVVLSSLYKNTDDPAMRGYLAACHRLATIPEVCIRLILFAPLTRLMFSEHVSQVPNKKLGRIDWKSIRKLNHMPHWAVDKHTFRGKFGHASKTILKKKPHGMTESEYNEFHGVREKRDLQSFFAEGVKCTQEALEENPFWDRMKELYFLQPPKQQKLQSMTEQYYDTLQAKYPELFQANKSVFFDYKQSNGEVKQTAGQRKLQDFFKPTNISSPSIQSNEDSNSPIFTMPLEPISSRQDSYGYPSLSTKAPSKKGVQISEEEIPIWKDAQPHTDSPSKSSDEQIISDHQIRSHSSSGDSSEKKTDHKSHSHNSTRCSDEKVKPDHKSHTHNSSRGSGEKTKPDHKSHTHSSSRGSAEKAKPNHKSHSHRSRRDSSEKSKSDHKSHTHSSSRGSAEKTKPDHISRSHSSRRDSSEKTKSDHKVHTHSSRRDSEEQTKQEHKSQSPGHDSHCPSQSSVIANSKQNSQTSKHSVLDKPNSGLQDSLVKDERKFKVSAISKSDAWNEGMSRAKRRRLAQVKQRNIEYETERLDDTRKVTGVMADGFVTAAKKLGCPITLPDNLFDAIEFMKVSKVKSSHSMAFSDDSGSEFLNVSSPLKSPLTGSLRNVSDTSGNRRSTPSQSTRTNVHDLSPESNSPDKNSMDGLEDEFEDDMPVEMTNDVKEEQLMSQDKETEEGAEDEETLSFRGPLLQLPTSANKVYTVADIEEEKAVKGPYRDKAKLHQVMFFHQCMRDVIGDPHTLDFEPEPPYLMFPLMKGHGASMEITTRDFTDCISQADIEEAEFLTRDCLGIIQLHKLPPNQIRKLPMSIWAHFLFRFALNVGDSGLYNSITDSKLAFVYGVGMEELRGDVRATQSVLEIMFSKAPRKELCETILLSIRHKKKDLFKIVAKPINYAQMDRLAREYGVKYDRLLFIERIKKVRQLVAKL